MEKLKIALAALTFICIAALPGAASAASININFACTDGSQDIRIVDGFNNQQVVTCTSGAKINYTNFDSSKALAVKVTCPSGENVGSRVDTPNQPTSRYIFYCVLLSNSGTSVHTNNTPNVTQTTAATGSTPHVPTGDKCGGDVSGHQYSAVYTDFNFGCMGKGNAIMDLMFAIVRFLSAGVGLVVVASMAWAGIQYTSSRGDPQATAKAVHRIRANVVALLVFIFAYAILNFVIPGAVLG